jgi:hypothetical protein
MTTVLWYNFKLETQLWYPNLNVCSNICFSLYAELLLETDNGLPKIKPKHVAAIFMTTK